MRTVMMAPMIVTRTIRPYSAEEASAEARAPLEAARAETFADKEQ